MSDNTEKIHILISTAYKCLGASYKYGAELKEAPNAFDCSSFTQYLYSLVGVELYRRSIDQACEGIIEVGKNDLQPGDLIFIKGDWGRYNPRFPQGVGHVLIYVGNGKVIHAKGEEIDQKQIGKVRMDDVELYINRDDVAVIKRYL